MDVPTHLPTHQVLDALAHVVAAALDDGDERRAWALTRALEAMAGAGAEADGEQPPSPVIGRRFAMAHRRLLALASTAGAAALIGERRSREVMAQARGAGWVADPRPAG